MDHQEQLKEYRVRVGHVEIHVKARDVCEAVRVARRHLSQELPRLYDVIRSMAPSRFEVDHAA